MMQSNRMSFKDPISLDGFEDLMNQIFEPRGKMRQIKLESSLPGGAPNLVASNKGKILTGQFRAKDVASVSGKTTARYPAVPRPISNESVVAPVELSGELNLLNAQLDFALKALAKADLRERALRVKVAALEDKVSAIPILLEKAARLRELESCMSGWLVRLTNLI